MNSLVKFISNAVNENRKLFYGFILIFILTGILVTKKIYMLHAIAQEEIQVKNENIGLLLTSLERSRESGSLDSDKVNSLEKGLLIADKPSIAAAMLQKSFKGAASKHGVKIMSERPLKPVEAGGYLKVPIEFQLKSDMPGLKGLLADLRSSEPAMAIEAIAIRKTENGVLDIVLTIVGAMRKSNLE